MARRKNEYSKITKDIVELAELASDNSRIDPDLYEKYEVKRGLRDRNGKGVLTGLTEISEIQAFSREGDLTIPAEGKLYYRGVDIEQVISGIMKEKRFGFEEVTYLLLYGVLPTEEQLSKFTKILAGYRTLPRNFVRDVIMKAPTNDMMNSLMRSVLTLYAYDSNANDISLPNVMRQCLQLIANFSVLAVYGYQAYSHYIQGSSLVIHPPKPELSTAENILHMLRPDSRYSEMEAHILDVALILHAEHGGGNNSTFTTHVVTSSGSDTYSTIAAALSSLKGPKHGGANIKVIQMFEDMKKNISDWKNEKEVRDYLSALLNKRAFDKSGLIYGMGHAVYSLSDPRAKILKTFVKDLSEEKGMEEEFQFYSLVERLASEVIAEERRIYKGVSANVDFYSGLVYQMLGLPLELFTPIFAIARISGWSAHRMEELINGGKIIRPAYLSVLKHKDYIPLAERSAGNQ
ncbi:MAG: citrate/2-methylcitrate synthase [Clostridiales bacterium]|jgi:citrate synthase|nr:citrate/2-methylcitrate synthase [Clostridiales bacterium]